MRATVPVILPSIGAWAPDDPAPRRREQRPIEPDPNLTATVPPPPPPPSTSAPIYGGSSTGGKIRQWGGLEPVIQYESLEELAARLKRKRTKE